ncbi:MAG: hypothetical protein KAJ07_07325 [Planctomycetes bacterium]|nr:hypothetical protein [Planctomycetota bacterium]
MDAFEIIKKRYPEVVLIIGLQAGLVLLARQIMATAMVAAGGGEDQVAGQLPGGIEFVYGMGFAIVCIVWQILQLGFLRTAFTDGASQQEPKTLLVTGKAFFWRMLRFQIIFGLAYQFMIALGTGVIASTMYKDVAVADLPVWLGPACAMAAMAALAKPMLLCPALMIAEGCMVRESFARMKGFRLSTHSKMIKTFAVFIVMMFVFGTAEGLMKAKGAGQSVIIAVQAMITGTVGLVMSLYAIQFVAGKDVLTAEDAENAEEEDAENI